MTEFDTLFVYGTLKQGGKWSHLLDGQRLLGEDSIQGEMYLEENGSYPILYLGAGAVRGEVYQVDEDALGKVTELEADAGYEYVPIKTASGRDVSVFCYTDPSNLDPSTAILSFDAMSSFKKWLESTPEDSDSFREFIRLGGKRAQPDVEN